MNVLSLFDGMSCGQIALNQLGFKIENYYASEIDKYAMMVAKDNFPNIIHIGDVLDVNGKELDNIDLLIGGSPCQGFSFAGKQLSFDDPRSKLFFEFVRLLEETRPKYFLLENVKMIQMDQDIISKYLGVKPIEINAGLVSAQNRRRLYWTNIPNIEQPLDREIYIDSIIEKKEDVDPKYNLSVKAKAQVEKYSKNYKLCGKSPTLTTELAHSVGKNITPKLFKEIDQDRRATPLECERLQTVPDHYSSCVSDTQRYKMLGNGWTVDVIKHIFKNII